MEPPLSKRIPRERLEYVERLYLAGRPDHRISQLVARRYGVTLRTARNYLARIRARLAALPKPPPEAVAQRVEAMLLDAYGKARRAIKVVTWTEADGSKQSKEYAAPETGTMVVAAVRLGELHGVLAPRRVEHSGAIDVGNDPQALHDRLAALAARAASDADAAGTGATDPGGADGDRAGA